MKRSENKRQDAGKMLTNLGEDVNQNVQASFGNSPICNAKSESKDISYRYCKFKYAVPHSLTRTIRHFVLSSFKRDANCQLGEDTRYKLEERIAGKNETVKVH